MRILKWIDSFLVMKPLMGFHFYFFDEFCFQLAKGRGFEPTPFEVWKVSKPINQTKPVYPTKIVRSKEGGDVHFYLKWQSSCFCEDLSPKIFCFFDAFWYLTGTRNFGIPIQQLSCIRSFDRISESNWACQMSRNYRFLMNLIEEFVTLT